MKFLKELRIKYIYLVVNSLRASFYVFNVLFTCRFYLEPMAIRKRGLFQFCTFWFKWHSGNGCLLSSSGESDEGVFCEEARKAIF